MAKRRRYSPTEIDAALATLAATGSSFEASQRTGINPHTLRHWKTLHHDRYTQIAEREAPKLEAIAAQQAREIMVRAGETEHTLLDTLNKRINDDAPTKELSELAGTLQRVTTSKGINGTKLLELTGRPTQIVEHREGTDILRALASKVPGLVIDGTATELPHASQQAPSPASHGTQHATKALTAETAIANAREPAA
jgi:transposase-like protein